MTETTSTPAIVEGTPAAPPRRLLWALFALSALILFLEMLLVRWIGTELRVFAYLQNGVLIAAFLGLGLGARNARRPAALLGAAVSLLFIALVIRDPLGWQIGEAVTQGLTGFQDSVVWAATGAKVPYERTALVFFAVAVSFAVLAAVAWAFHPLGQWLGRWMDAHPRPIVAYSANILGSLVGIAAFVAATVVDTQPWLWLLLCALGLLALVGFTAESGRRRVAAAAAIVALPIVAWTSTGGNTVWSPYQKLNVGPLFSSSLPSRSCGQIIMVNNTGYQLILDLDPKDQAKDPEMYPPAEIPYSHYVLPYRLVGDRKDVLIVGAGAGNDAAAALRAGAQSVRAVEIDPAIVRLGSALHPNRPYSSDRVKVTVDDARAFFRSDRGQYDLVWFGLLDSHVNPSAYSNVRLDHFVYTRQSLADVRRLLKPNGVVVVLFEAQTPWIADRLARLLRDTFGTPPLGLWVRSSTLCLGWGGLLLVGGPPEALAPIRARAVADEELLRRVIPSGSFTYQTITTTDDWPYLYLPRPTLPRYHLLVAIASLVLALALRRRLFRPGDPVNVTMVLLGAAFMLLEVAGVSRAALLFGTTWTVNAYVVGAILAMVLLANLVAERYHARTPRWAPAGLVLSLLALVLAPISWLAGLPGPVRIVVGGLFLALPVFFSGLVFVTLWANEARRDLALGSNLLGSLLGGVASMLSMLFGFQALALLTLAVYLGALLGLRKQGAAGAGAGAAA